MNLSPSFLTARVGLGLAIVALAGCSSQPMASIGVSSPPPPLIGSAPIAAYDDYARATAPSDNVRMEAVARVDRQ